MASEPAIAGLLKDDRLAVRHATILALGRSRDRTMVDHLAPFLLDEDSTARALAIQALGRVGGRRARRMLESLGRQSPLTAIERTFLQAALRTATRSGGRG